MFVATLDSIRCSPYRYAKLVSSVPADKLVVSESGIHSRAQIVQLENAGVDAFLIGEALLREEDLGRKLRELRGEGQ